MEKRSKTALMWGLYAILFLLVLVIQSVFLGRVRVLGGKFDLLPMVIVCIALWTGHEKAALFGLIAALVWQMAGAEDGIVAIVTYPLTAALAGWLFDSWLPRGFLPCLLLCLVACLCQQCLVFLLKYYVEGISLSLALRIPVTAALSCLAVPVLYGLSKAIGKVGGV